MSKKRAQLSVFVMIGIVLFVAFIFLFSITYALSKGRLNSQIKQMASKKDIVDSLKTNLQSCLKSSADKGLLLIGKQAGFIFEEQGGNSKKTDVAFEEIDNKNRFYWLLKNSWDMPPGYPQYENNLGFAQIPMLQKEDIPKEQQGFKPKYPFIKDELAKYMQYDFKQCVNLSYFENEGMQIKEKGFSLEITFADDGTNFYLNYPLDVTMESYTEQITKIPPYKSDIRFKRMYEIAKNLVNEDKTNLLFLFENDIVNGFRYNPLSPAVVVSKIPGKDYDMITVTDNKRKINDKPYQLVFLRQNRNPVLKYVPDISVNISDTIDFQPFAFDPDEDDINITIEKWKFEIATQDPLQTTGHYMGADKEHYRFTPQAEDIGIYYYNMTVEDVAGLKDWQNEVKAYVYCEYSASADMGNEMGKNVWHAVDASGKTKTYSYNPQCCNENGRLSFKEGQTVTMANGKTCTCTKYGQCEGQQGEECTTPSAYFCHLGKSCYCNENGKIDGDCEDCEYGCSSLSGHCKPEDDGGGDRGAGG